MNMKFYALILFVATLCLSCKKTEKPIEEEGNEEEVVVDDRANSLNIMTYNLYRSGFETDPTSPKSWDFRKGMVIQVLKKYKVDILCGQEDDLDQGDDIVEALGFAKVGVTKYEGKIDGNGEFNAIYYNPDRFTKKESGYFWLSETPDVPSQSWDADGKVICNWALMLDEKTNKEFYIFNTHLDYGGAISRNRSANILKQYISDIAGDKPVILAGDMNCRPDTEPIKTFKSFLNNAFDVSVSAPTGSLGTYNTFNINYVSKDRIDYVFVTKDIDVFTYHTAPDSKKGYYPSDHFPIICEISIQ